MELSSVVGGSVPEDVGHNHVRNLRNLIYSQDFADSGHFVICTCTAHLSCCLCHMVAIKIYNLLANVLNVYACKEGGGLNHVT